MVQTLLGLLPLAPYELLILDPSLPEWLPDITAAQPAHRRRHDYAAVLA
jgi:hypothetical protein